MNKFLLLLLFVLLSSGSSAQIKYQDVIYLKNGSIIRGMIIEYVLNKSMKIETSDRNVFVFQIEEIEKIAKEPYKANTLVSSISDGKGKGFKGIVEIGHQSGTSQYGMNRLMLNIINGYQIRHYISLGLGTGLRYYLDKDLLLIPVFANISVNMTDNEVSPFFSLGVGYSLDATNGLKEGGMMLNPKAGVDVKISDGFSINIGFGYEMQKIFFFDYGSNKITKELDAISISIGLSY